MRLFFCSVGFTASFKVIKSGGKLFVILLLSAFFLIVMQNVIGIVTVTAFGLQPGYGLALGSISLTGGHGTSAAYADILVKRLGLEGADAVALASATFGMVVASIMAGPMAKRLINRDKLHPTSEEIRMEEEERPSSNKNRHMMGFILMIVCLGAGTLLDYLFSMIGVAVPAYLGALILAIIIRNIAELKGLNLPVAEIQTIGWLALGLFLAMALMELKLWQLVELALPMVVTLVLQAAALAAFTYYILFKVSGRNYDSAVACAGVVGFAMGATPNAMASMEAVTNEFGPSQTAYLTVPIVSGVFLDLMNVTILAVLLGIM